MRATFDAAGDVIVITGGANGICAALARAIADRGGQAVICDIDRVAGEALAETHRNIEFRPLDVSSREEVCATMSQIERCHGKIDGLVCGAAVQPRWPVVEADPDQWRSVISINLDGLVWCYQAVAPGMIERRSGSVVAFTSGLAATGWPCAAAYAASKAAISAFVRSIAKEEAKHGLRINLIAPGVIDTPQYRQANVGTDAEHWQSATGVGQSSDVVGPLLFLLSNAATMTASLLSRDYAFRADYDG